MNQILYNATVGMAPRPAEGQNQPSPMVGLMPIFIMFAILYFLILRPQQKRAKEHKAMLSAIEVGDEVITTGGLYGRVTRVGEKELTLEIAEKVRVRVARDQISTKTSAEAGS